MKACLSLMVTILRHHCYRWPSDNNCCPVAATAGAAEAMAVAGCATMAAVSTGVPFVALHWPIEGGFSNLALNRER